MAEPLQKFQSVRRLKPMRFYSITAEAGFSRKNEERKRWSGGFGAVRQREHRRSSGRGRCSRAGSGAPLRITWPARALRRNSRGVPRALAFRLFLKPHNKLIRDFPAKIFGLAALHQTLLQKNGAPRIGNKCPRSRQKNIPGAVMHLDPAPEQHGIAGHTQPVSKPLVMGSIVRKDSPAKTCGKAV
jgi:hypothetical protein